MKEMTLNTRAYMFSVYFVGIALFIWNMLDWQISEPIMLAVLSVLASLALVIKVVGATQQTHYAFSFIVYGFTFAHLGLQATIVVILISNVMEFLINRPAWFGPVFNTSCYIIGFNLANLVFDTLMPVSAHFDPIYIAAVMASLMVFVLLNHLMVGIIIWMAEGQNFKESGIFDLYPMILDLSLLALGAMLVLIWDTNPFALILFIFPVYLIYTTMRVPALERRSETDQKTGLYNHAYFMKYLENELNRANRFDRPITIIMADLDLLRNINNTYGHLAGDEVLIGIAKILKNSVREYDLVSRFGGEEFSILLPETTVEQGYQRAESIRQAVEKAEFSVPTSVEPIKATLSMGLANRENFSQSGQDIIHNADTALYHSKLRGRNRVFAYTKNAFVDFFGFEKEKISDEATTEKLDASLGMPVPTPKDSSSTVPAAVKKDSSVQSHTSPPKQTEEEKVSTPPGKKNSKSLVNPFIGGILLLSLFLLGGLYLSWPASFQFGQTQDWLGLIACMMLVVAAEGFSIDLYERNVSLSTSAVPILAGTLLFGPIAAFLLSLTYALTTGIKHKSKFNRYVFNFSNHLLAGTIYLGIIFFLGGPFSALPTLSQLIFAVMAAIVSYVVNTGLISIVVYFDAGLPIIQFWKENYSWLIFIYLGMGIVAESFVFGYKYDPLIGSLLIIAPLVLLRVSQIQYLDRTRNMASELHRKNADLESYSIEISKLNEGLLDTLAEVIDLRDPYVLGHSRNVTDMATKIAKRLGLHEKQVELVHKGGLLHDIGKIGISQEILAKPGSLSPEEYYVVKTHPKLGADLLEKSAHLRQLIPIVHQHHEYFDGNGYPDKLAGNQITMEARVVSVADAIEAMLSDRPYRSARSIDYVISELKRCSNSQFDPLVVEAAIKVLREIESNKVTEKAIERARSQD